MGQAKLLQITAKPIDPELQRMIDERRDKVLMNIRVVSGDALKAGYKQLSMELLHLAHYDLVGKSLPDFNKALLAIINPFIISLRIYPAGRYADHTTYLSDDSTSKFYYSTDDFLKKWREQIFSKINFGNPKEFDKEFEPKKILILGLRKLIADTHATKKNVTKGVRPGTMQHGILAAIAAVPDMRTGELQTSIFRSLEGSSTLTHMRRDGFIEKPGTTQSPWQLTELGKYVLQQAGPYTLPMYRQYDGAWNQSVLPWQLSVPDRKELIRLKSTPIPYGQGVVRNPMVRYLPHRHDQGWEDDTN
jgi:hypothetical protein